MRAKYDYLVERLMNNARNDAFSIQRMRHYLTNSMIPIIRVKDWMTWTNDPNMDDCFSLLKSARPPFKNFVLDIERPEHATNLLCAVKVEKVHRYSYKWNMSYVEYGERHIAYATMITNAYTGAKRVRFPEGTDDNKMRAAIDIFERVLSACVLITSKNIRLFQGDSMLSEDTYDDKKTFEPGKVIELHYKVSDKKARELGIPTNYVRMSDSTRITQRIGHWKTYTEERPLFGKYVGTWYWQGFVYNPEVSQYAAS
jgi:hypothetical protein